MLNKVPEVTICFWIIKASTGWRSWSPSRCAPRPVTSSRSDSTSGTGFPRVKAVLAFWIAYILTRLLGASLGDYLSQPSDSGGLGLGTVAISALFLSTIVSLVVYLTITRKDEAGAHAGVSAQRSAV